MYIIATFQPVLYWIGISCTYHSIGLLSFGLFKFIATFVSEVYYFYFLTKFLDLSWKELLKKIIYPISIPLVFLIATLLIVIEFLPVEKSKINLFLVLSSTGTCIAISFLIQYFISSNIREVSKNLIGSIFQKN
jgi:hypothetical protein